MPAIVGALSELEQAVTRLGTALPSTLMTLSFVALPVVPELRLTDLGLFDLNQLVLLNCK
jgi:adenine deaminase